ncbi:hypothetical protein [Acidaminococcus massiliensis]|jgi:uncharacterized membrane protein|uniref:hypothetical protein n=1 Tax=Acidaminococcus massiliensis TaxID=1852375 RepID=UPI0023F03E61|nr:hypothetical protein [Acidaminococcus massiliensis]
MEFFLLVLLLTLVSFSMAVLCYGLTLRFCNGSKWARYILTPLLVVGWDFLVVIQEQTLRWVLGLLPIAVVGILFLYARKKYAEDPEPLELARKQNGFTMDRKMRRYQKKNQKKSKK